MNIHQLVLYRHFRYQSLFESLCGLSEEESGEKKSRNLYDCANGLIELAGKYGFEGNLWHCFLAFCLANNENAYSTASEIVGKPAGTLNDLMLNDCMVFKELFDRDLMKCGKEDDAEECRILNDLSDYHAAGTGKVFNKRIRDRIVELAVSLEKTKGAEEFKDIVTEFYREFGVGKFGLNKAFDVEELSDGKAYIEPITRIEHIYLKDLVGYEMQKKALTENMEAFLAGLPANNVLLFGDAGTGKSSCVKAIENEYYDRGLRIIEVYKHQFKLLSDILEQVKDRNYKFIIYMDDLSFEESELEYKYLKAILEGGLGKRPQNVMIVATSNRRHLIRESFRDKEEVDEELHTRDTVQEKLSLAARFGLTIYFGSPDRKEFREIVKALARRNGIEMPEQELFDEAGRWELEHGGLSGRTASQFIIYLQGRKSSGTAQEAGR